MGQCTLRDTTQLLEQCTKTCAAYGLEVSSFQWQTPPKVVENYTVKVLWVFKFQTDKQLAKHSDIMVDQKAHKTAACDLIWVET